MRKEYTGIWSGCALLITASWSVAATTTLGDGGNLPAAVAAAQHGDVIELHSNGPFPGNLTWTNKYLTIRAGSGFQPVVQGQIQSVLGNALTGGTFQGLTMPGGLRASTTGTRFATYVIEDSTIDSDIQLSGTGDFHVDITARDSMFLGGVSMNGTGRMSIDAMFEGNQLLGGMTMGGTGSQSIDAILERNLIDTQFFISPIANEQVHNVELIENDFLIRPVTSGGSVNYSHRNIDFIRNRLRRGITFNVGNFNNLEGRCFSIRMGVSQLRLSEMVEDFAAEASLRDLIG